MIHEIVATGERIVAARDGGDAPVRTDGVWSLLSAIERSEYWLSISDIARKLCISRQAARVIVHKALRQAEVTALGNRDAGRLLQVRLTERGRATLKSSRAHEAGWVIALLDGLDDRDMHTVTHVLRVIRQRLVRDERESRLPEHANDAACT
jgi:DNA-binding MarR family transcriptional regulator